MNNSIFIEDRLEKLKRKKSFKIEQIPEIEDIMNNSHLK